MTLQTFTLIGSAPNALALAAELRLRGHPVILTERPGKGAALARLAATGEMKIRSQIDTVPGGRQETTLAGFEVIEDTARAVARADVVIVMVPAPFHEALIDGFGPALRNEQILLFVPGGLGEALMVSRMVAGFGVPDVLIAQTAVTPVGGRLGADGVLTLASKKRVMPVGVFPASRAPELLARLKDAFPEFTPSADVIENGLARAGLGLHPIPMIMNATQIEQKGPYLYDAYDITPGIARVIEAVDAERLAILRALGAEESSFVDILRQAYGVSGETFYEAVHDVASYRQVASPPDMAYRYLSEDVPTQVVPAASLARALGIATPMFDAVIAFSGALHGVDYWQTGWNLEKLGLEGLDADEIIALVRGETRVA